MFTGHFSDAGLGCSPKQLASIERARAASIRFVPPFNVPGLPCYLDPVIHPALPAELQAGGKPFEEPGFPVSPIFCNEPDKPSVHLRDRGQPVIVLRPEKEPMKIERFYLGCLAHASYLVHDSGDAAVIDPRRDVNLYVEEAHKRKLRIRWIIETHLHADFVSGHLELASLGGATICIGAGSGAAFKHRALKDGDQLPLGDKFLRVLSRPGHTEESVCVVVEAPLQSSRETRSLSEMSDDRIFRPTKHRRSWHRCFSTACIRRYWSFRMTPLSTQHTGRAPCADAS
jgi:hypothetical protein